MLLKENYIPSRDWFSCYDANSLARYLRYCQNHVFDNPKLMQIILLPNQRMYFEPSTDYSRGSEIRTPAGLQPLNS